MRGVWILVVGLTVSSFSPAQDSSQKGDDAQTTAAVKQISSELLSAAEHSDVGDIADDPKGKIAGLRYDVRMSDCENRWIALYHKTEDADYTYGFVYTIRKPDSRCIILEFLQLMMVETFIVHLIPFLQTRPA